MARFKDNNCPVCKSKNIEFRNSFVKRRDVIVVYGTCNACLSTFEEIYKRSSVETIVKFSGMKGSKR